jgi:hypothetical protein
MKRNVYFLVFLLFWVQFDDPLLLVLSSTCPSAPLLSGDDEEEYLVLHRSERQARLDHPRQPRLVRAIAQAPDSTLVGSCPPSERKRATPFAPPPLYVFMSFQI